ncbi:MAG: hypothetical protein O9335_12695 [Inhella sp.]|uniref:hypothetical protein n=1 Tax=Inhella sp. TaxID=1921806 RepID=UPI0022C1A5BA|nr:hypothetical protein [Inhella sp.]MCZ8236004.1 hypothetical protein [Inhella sp.]
MLEFKSEAFAIAPGEDEATNPGIFGKALAEWLAGELIARGHAAGEVIAEDFGWCVPVESKPHALYVACASADEQPGSWRVFAFAEGGLLGRIFRKDTRDEDVARIYGSVKAAITARVDVRDVLEEPA